MRLGGVFLARTSETYACSRDYKGRPCLFRLRPLLMAERKPLDIIAFDLLDVPVKSLEALLPYVFGKGKLGRAFYRDFIIRV